MIDWLRMPPVEELEGMEDCLGGPPFEGGSDGTRDCSSLVEDTIRDHSQILASCGGA